MKIIKANEHDAGHEKCESGYEKYVYVHCKLSLSLPLPLPAFRHLQHEEMPLPHLGILSRLN